MKHIENCGIEFILSGSVDEFGETSALLKSGNTIDFDVLVIAVGVRPNIGLIENAGGKVNRGILIDSASKTTLPDIYAAGDCTVP
jgi:NAD(P)H-nitrite reductase large subunit